MTIKILNYAVQFIEQSHHERGVKKKKTKRLDFVRRALPGSHSVARAALQTHVQTRQNTCNLGNNISPYNYAESFGDTSPI